MTELVTGRALATADEAAAYAAMLARVRAIGCYPITPQTVIVERLADLVAGREDVEFANVESEHSTFAYVAGASKAGVRTFTATSSQGLLYAHEQLHRISRDRIPIVAVNINRALLAPWSIEPDLADSMSQRDTGWIQLYCASAQEMLDSVLCAYRIAETVMLPVLVCAEGFLLSHTSELLDVPGQEAVDAFLPAFEAPADWVLDPDVARSFAAVPEPHEYYAFQRGLADAMDETLVLLESVSAEFGSHFGRPKVAALEITGNPDAESALVTIGTIGDTAQELLEEDGDLLLVRVHAYRPFPSEQMRAVLSKASYVSVIDRAPGFGSFGPLGDDVRSLGIPATNYVLGLGGMEVTPATLRWVLDETRSGGAGVAPVWVREEV